MSSAGVRWPTCCPSLTALFMATAKCVAHTLLLKYPSLPDEAFRDRQVQTVHSDHHWSLSLRRHLRNCLISDHPSVRIFEPCLPSDPWSLLNLFLIEFWWLIYVIIPSIWALKETCELANMLADWVTWLKTTAVYVNRAAILDQVLMNQWADQWGIKK